MRAKIIETSGGDLAICVDAETYEERMLLRQFVIQNQPVRALSVLECAHGGGDEHPGGYQTCVVGWTGRSLPDVVDVARGFVDGTSSFADLADAVRKQPAAPTGAA